MIYSDGYGTAVKWNTTSSSCTVGDWYINTDACTGNSTWANTSATAYNGSITYRNVNSLVREIMPSRIPAGKRELELPDGAKLIIDDLGNYRIEDTNAKVTYQANRIREFSPHINASDLLADFVKYVGRLGVKQTEVLSLPIELFINWLVIEAAERYQDPIPEGVKQLKDSREIKTLRKPQCVQCGRFIPIRHQQKRFPFCKVEHARLYLERDRRTVPRLPRPAPAPVAALPGGAAVCDGLRLPGTLAFSISRV